MSENLPTPQEIPPAREPLNTERIRTPEEVAAENSVPPTEPPPQEEIDTVVNNLRQNQRAARNTSTPAATAPSANTSPTQGVPGMGSGGGHSKGGVLSLFGGAFKLLRFFFTHVVWHAVTHAPEMAKGGGHSKPKASGGGGHGGH